MKVNYIFVRFFGLGSCIRVKLFPLFILLGRFLVGVDAERNYQFRSSPIVQNLVWTDTENLAYEVSHPIINIKFSVIAFSDLTDRFIFFYALPSDYPKKRSVSLTTDGLFFTICIAVENTSRGSIHSISSGAIRSTAPTSS